MCEAHRDELMSVRQEFDKTSPVAEAWRQQRDIDAEAYRDMTDFARKKRKRPPTCSRVGCENERVKGEAFCPQCQAEGANEDD